MPKPLSYNPSRNLCVTSLLQERSICFKSLQEQIDTTTSGGKLIFHVFGALAEFERDLIRERTQAGLLAARAGGRLGGRPKALNARTAQIAQSLYQDKTSITDICRTLRISRATLYRYIQEGLPVLGPAQPRLARPGQSRPDLG